MAMNLMLSNPSTPSSTFPTTPADAGEAPERPGGAAHGNAASPARNAAAGAAHGATAAADEAADRAARRGGPGRGNVAPDPARGPLDGPPDVAPALAQRQQHPARAGGDDGRPHHAADTEGDLGQPAHQARRLLGDPPDPVRDLAEPVGRAAHVPWSASPIALRATCACLPINPRRSPVVARMRAHASSATPCDLATLSTPARSSSSLGNSAEIDAPSSPNAFWMAAARLSMSSGSAASTAASVSASSSPSSLLRTRRNPSIFCAGSSCRRMAWAAVPASLPA